MPILSPSSRGVATPILHIVDLTNGTETGTLLPSVLFPPGCDWGWQPVPLSCR